MTLPPPIQRLGAFVAGLRHAPPPDDVTDTLVLRVVDTVAAQLHGVRAGHARLPLRVFDAPGVHPVWGTDRTRGWRDAVVLNAALSHATYFEDGSRFTGGHPASAVIPAAFVLATELGLDGAVLLSAIAAGYEVFLRLGRAIYPAVVQRGFQSTAVLAAPASAAAAAVLLGLDATATTHAIAIACSQGAGLKEALRCIDSQPMQVGRSSEGGVLAAHMARHGATGSPQILGHGFLRAFGGDAGPRCLPTLVEGLGERWHLGETYVKLHGGCRGNHAPTDAVLALVQRHGVQADDVRRIDVSVDTVTRAAAIEPPHDAAQAQSSIGFSIASALVHGDVAPTRFDAATLADPRIGRLIGLTHISADASLDEGYPQRRAASVTIELASGRVLSEHLERARGEPECPVEPGHICAKFDAIAPQVLGQARAADLRGCLLGLLAQTTLAPIARLLQAPAAASGTSLRSA